MSGMKKGWVGSVSVNLIPSVMITCNVPESSSKILLKCMAMLGNYCHPVLRKYVDTMNRCA